MPDASVPTASALSVLMVASEAHPYAKTGGLADVTGALSGALARLGHAVTLVMPRYRAVDVAGRVGRRLSLTMGGRPFEVGLVEVVQGPRERVVLVECDELYDREGLYGTGGQDHPDNAVRFGVLARAALEYAVGLESAPSIVHAHDWQTGLVPVLLRTRYTADPVWRRIPSLFTIHNLAYQGVFPAEMLSALDLGAELLSVDGLEFWNQLSFLKGGINFADAVTTVSAAYAREIRTDEYGEGLQGLLVHRQHVLSGILNGIDTDIWNPLTDPYLPAPFSAVDVKGKQVAKRALLTRYGLPDDAAAMARPLIGMVSRLVEQKGLGLIWEARDALVAMDAAFVILGSGERRYEAMWRDLAAAHPMRIGARIGFDEELSHLIEGGADLFLMPSRFEPCGLNQMYSMRYGTVPVVRATGGLDDTVQAFDPETGGGTGFTFHEYRSSAMLVALEAALATYARPARWRTVQQAGMRQDYSWDASAAAYVHEYRKAIDRRREGVGDREE
jgi:starch synthase